jgi:hypothetical protein
VLTGELAFSGMPPQSKLVSSEVFRGALEEIERQCYELHSVGSTPLPGDTYAPVQNVLAPEQPTAEGARHLNLPKQHFAAEETPLFVT